MPTYSYKAKSFEGKEKSGTAQASSKHELAQNLHNEGYLLIFAKSVDKNSTSITNLILAKLNRVKAQDKMVFAKNLASMAVAGLTVSKALDVLAKQTKNKYFAGVIEEIKQKVQSGSSFSETLALHPSIFDELFCSMVAVGENTGNLDKVLKLLAEQIKRDYALRSRIKGAMIYPAVVMTAVFGIGFALMVLFIPRLSETFNDLNIQLPITTQIIISIGNFLSQHIILSLLVIVAIIIGIKTFIARPTGKKVWHFVLLRLPVFGELSKKVNAARFSRVMSSLLAGGVPIVRSLEITGRTLGNIFFKESMGEIAKQAQKGISLFESMNPFEKLYPPMVLQMIEVGEHSGLLDKVLADVAEFYEEEVDDIVKNMSSLIEPLIMVVIGGAVAFLAIAMIQPLYGMLNSI